MAKRICILLLLLALSVGYVYADGVSIVSVVYVTVDPSGACTNLYITVNKTSGGVSTCKAGTWTLLPGSSSGLTSLNGLSAATQTFVNDTNVTVVSAGSTHTLTWAGTLAKNRLLATVVYNDQSNTYSTGTQDFTSAAHLRLINGLAASKPATCTTGEVYFGTDSTAGQNLFYCTATNTWTQQIAGGASTGTSIQKGNGSGGFSAALAADVVALFSTCSGTQYLGADGVCHTASGSGTVTVVGGGSLTSTAIVTGGGTTTVQTPSSTATVDSSGNISTPGGVTAGAGGSAAGYLNLGQGTACSLGTTSTKLCAGSSVTSSIQLVPSAPADGFFRGDNSSSTVTWSQVELSAVNPQTTNYQVLASDFSSYKTITVASGSPTITLVANTSQPTAGQYITVVNYGSGVVTIARSGQNINGGTTSLLLYGNTSTTPSSARVISDGTNYFASLSFSQGVITMPNLSLSNSQVQPVPTASGTTHSLNGPNEIWVCTGACTVTPPTPAAGYQFCVRNATGTSGVITLAAIASSFYEKTDSSAYGTVNTSSTSGGAVGDKICLVGLDSTHYLTLSYAGTWSMP